MGAATQSVAGVGTYALDTTTATITFVPASGFSGVAPAISYRVTDAAAQTGTATYTATVTKPAAPTAGTLTTSGIIQQVQVVLRAGDGISLLDAAGNAETTVTVAGQGRYTLDRATGVITFTPIAGFSGAAAGIRYRVSDGYGQQADDLYRPTVIRAAPRISAAVLVPALTVIRGTSSQFRRCAGCPGAASLAAR